MVNGVSKAKGIANTQQLHIQKLKLRKSQGLYLRISNRNCLFTVKMDVFKDVTLMGVILTHRKGNLESRAEALNWLPLLVYLNILIAVLGL